MKKQTLIGSVLGLALLTTIGLAWSTGKARKTTENGIGWYNTVPDALGEAKQTHKPILLLSMFGHLDEEMPCANARTLRATLFKDPEFKKLVSEEVIPAWEMVREVPKINIDFGDGKKITRTVRGNAVMYLCNPDGKVVDAFPGIYTAKDFIPAIKESIDQLVHADAASVVAYHRSRGHMVPQSLTTATKAVVESPTLELIGAQPFAGARSEFRADSPDKQKFTAAALQVSDLSLRPMTPSEVIGTVTGGGTGDMSKVELENRILANDSRTNMVRVRPIIHLWLASDPVLPTPAQARDAVLQTILKIPYKDPYFGLKDVVMPGTPN